MGPSLQLMDRFSANGTKSYANRLLFVGPSLIIMGLFLENGPISRTNVPIFVGRSLLLMGWIFYQWAHIFCEWAEFFVIGTSSVNGPNTRSMRQFFYWRALVVKLLKCTNNDSFIFYNFFKFKKLEKYSVHGPSSLLVRRIFFYWARLLFMG